MAYSIKYHLHILLMGEQSDTKSNSSYTKSNIPSWAAVSSDCPYQNNSNRMYQKKNKRKMHCFPEKNIINLVL